jgi:hypothetical protein
VWSKAKSYFNGKAIPKTLSTSPGHGPTNREGMLAPLGGVVRPRRVVRFARLIQRRVRVLGGPAARVAFGDNLGLPCLLLRVMQHDEGPCTSYLPWAGAAAAAHKARVSAGLPDGIIMRAPCVRMGRAYDPCPIDGTRRIRNRVTRSTSHGCSRKGGAS